MTTDPVRVEMALLRTSRNLRRAFDTALSVLDLNLTQASLLSFVRDFSDLTQRELADHLHIGRASVGTFIDSLERRGLVARTADPTDRRTWRISLTDEGKRVVTEFDAIDEQVRADLRAGFTREERQLLAHLLIRLEENAVSVINLRGTVGQVVAGGAAP